MTRLFQAIAGARQGGAEAFFTRLTLALERDGVDQRVAIRRDPGRAAMLRAGGVETIELPFGGLFDFRTRPALGRILDEWRPELVLTWMSRATKLIPRAPSGRKGFVHAARLGGYYDLKYYRHCDHLIGNTQDIVAHLVTSGWPAARAHYLPNFVDDTIMPAAARHDWDTPEEAPLLLALGRLHANKAFDVLLDALAAVPGAYLWLAGEGPERASLMRRAESRGIAGRVRFLGWRQDGPALMAAADMLICPSRHEPLGNVILEAWAHRLPVIAAAAQGPLELIAPGVEGILVPIDDADALARAIGALIGDAGRRRALAEAGHAAYAARFAAPAVVAAYRAFFARVAT